MATNSHKATALTPQDNLSENLAIVLGIGLVWRLAYYIQMWRLCNASEVGRITSLAQLTSSTVEVPPAPPTTIKRRHHRYRHRHFEVTKNIWF